MAYSAPSGYAGLEGNWKTWTLAYSVKPAGTTGAVVTLTSVFNDGSVTALDRNGSLFLLDKNGNLIVLITSTATSNPAIYAAQSIGGTYKIFNDTVSGVVKILKNGVQIATITIDVVGTFTSFTVVSVAISLNGQYIALVGEDVTGTIDRVQVFKGS